AVAAVLASTVHQPLDLALGEIAPFNCHVYDGWSARFLLDLAEDWQQHGREVFKRVRRESPAGYLKVCAMLVPKELKFEHSGGVKAMTDKQLERGIGLIKEMLAQREGGGDMADTQCGLLCL